MKTQFLRTSSGAADNILSAWSKRVSLSVAFFGGLLACAPAKAVVYDVTNTSNSGAGSLRNAINSANASAVPDTINITANGVIRLSSPLPNLQNQGRLLIVNGSSGNVTISGDTNSSGTNDAGDASIFEVNAGADVEMRGLILSGGRATGASGGGVLNNGALVMSRCTIHRAGTNPEF